MSFCNPLLGVGVHTSKQNSHELGPHGMYSLMGKTDQNCGKHKDGKLQGTVINWIREVKFKSGHCKGHFWESGFHWRAEGLAVSSRRVLGEWTGFTALGGTWEKPPGQAELASSEEMQGGAPGKGGELGASRRGKWMATVRPQERAGQVQAGTGRLW